MNDNTLNPDLPEALCMATLEAHRGLFSIREFVSKGGLILRTVSIDPEGGSVVEFLDSERNLRILKLNDSALKAIIRLYFNEGPSHG